MFPPKQEKLSNYYVVIASLYEVTSNLIKKGQKHRQNGNVHDVKQYYHSVRLVTEATPGCMLSPSAALSKLTTPIKSLKLETDSSVD